MIESPVFGKMIIPMRILDSLYLIQNGEYITSNELLLVVKPSPTIRKYVRAWIAYIDHGTHVYHTPHLRPNQSLAHYPPMIRWSCKQATPSNNCRGSGNEHSIQCKIVNMQLDKSIFHFTLDLVHSFSNNNGNLQSSKDFLSTPRSFERQSSPPKFVLAVLWWFADAPRSCLLPSPTDSTGKLPSKKKKNPTIQVTEPTQPGSNEHLIDDLSLQCRGSYEPTHRLHDCAPWHLC